MDKPIQKLYKILEMENLVENHQILEYIQLKDYLQVALLLLEIWDDMFPQEDITLNEAKEMAMELETLKEDLDKTQAEYF